MLEDEIAIERLERAYDKAMSRYGGGMYCFDPEEERDIARAITGEKPKLLIPGVTDRNGDPLEK